MHQLNIGNRRQSAGFTIITALAFSLIVGTVLAGVGTVALSHFGRAHVEADYAGAITMADAGVNYELATVSRAIQSAGSASTINITDQVGTPHTSAEPFATGIPGHFKVFVRKWTATGCDGGNWNGIGDVCIQSTGTVNGISRTVQVRGRGEDVFNDYAIYSVSTNTSKWHGLGASGKTGVDGNVGSNGNFTLNGSGGTSAFVGTLYMNGPNATSPGAGGNVVHNTAPVNFPTVEQVANGLFPGGLTYLQTHNNNANIMMLKSSDPTLATEPTLAGLTLADVQSKMTSAGFTVASRGLSTLPLPVTKDTSTLDSNSGSRFVTDGQGVQNARPLFLPPGDYYFSAFSPATAVVALNHLGPVRIWIDSNTTTGDDLMHDIVLFTGPSAQTFKVYFNKCEDLSMHGGSQFHASLYAVKNCSNTSLPSVTFSGNNKWYGAIIAESFDVGGNSRIIFLNNGGSTDDPSPWFGFQDQWKELPAISGHPVFPDGTSN